MIVLHAVTPALRGRTEVDGLSVLTTGSVSLLHQESDAPPPANRTDIVAHGRRLGRLAEDFVLLPMRYGTTVTTRDDLDALVADRELAWSRRLSAVAGHDELLVHVELAAAASSGPRPATGRDYLRSRAAALHRRDSVWHAVEEAVRPYARELRRLPDGRRLAVLVPRHHGTSVRSALSAVPGDARVTVTGPWPPFSFCEEPSDE